MTDRYSTTRRTLLQGGLAALAAPLLPSFAFAAGGTCGIARQLAPKPERAVSLKQLSAALNSCGGDPAKCRDLLRFNGMTRLDGYIIDPDNKDIILWGGVEKGAPPLEFQDLAVALRSSHGRYAEKRDGVRYLMQPAISIDPVPEVWEALKTVKLKTPDDRRDFEQLCATPMTVRVEGMPRPTRLTNVLVDADYRMKRVVQGTLKLPIKPGIASPTVELWKAQLAASKRGLEPPRGRSARFWFEPGSFTYKVSYEGDTIFLDTAQVVLRDQVTSVSEGKVVDASDSEVDVFNRTFACAWTDRMEDTYRAEAIWRDMHNMFRHFAVARIIADRRDLDRVGFDGRHLLDTFRVPVSSLPDTVPGLDRLNDYHYTTRDGRKTINWSGWNSVCGGVSIAFNDNLKQHPDDGYVQGTGKMVLAARGGDVEKISWGITSTVIKLDKPDAVIAKYGSLAPKTADTEPVVRESIADILSRAAKAPKPAVTTPGSIKDILKKYSKT